MFVRFKVLHRDRAIALFTEGFGERQFHGRVAILVNEHTKSAAEMIAGRELPGWWGYRLRIPVGGWMTWNDRLLEGTGIAPQLR